MKPNTSSAIAALLVSSVLAAASLPASSAKAQETDAAAERPSKQEIEARGVRGELPSTPTNQWAVKLLPGTDPEGVALALGGRNLGQIGALEGYYLIELPGSAVTKAASDQAASAISKNAAVTWFEQQHLREYEKRDLTAINSRTPSDPYYGIQWHLRNTGQSGGTVGADANLLPAWRGGYTGDGVVVGIIDDGLQHSHPDLNPRYRADLSWDFNFNDGDPEPNNIDDPSGFSIHGTSVAGVTGAAPDGSTCGVGAAFEAELAGLRLISAAVSDATEASALGWMRNDIHVYNNSWGPSDNGAVVAGPGALAKQALLDGVNLGRGGLGSLQLWAGGNGRGNGDDSNYDGYANSPYTIAIAASTNLDSIAGYSDPGSNILVAAPSNGGTTGIVTTDDTRPGVGWGSTPTTNCINNFGGTSSASPLAAGVVALMLEANPDLTWRDVQHILVNSSRMPGGASTQTNGSNRAYSHDFGFGIVDAERAVELALGWQGVPSQTSTTVSSGAINLAIPDNNPTGVTSNINVPTSLVVEHVEFTVNVTHTWRGDLFYQLTSPSGTVSIVKDRPSDSGDNLSNWTFMSVANWGELSNGTWSLKVHDTFLQDTGTLNSWSLKIYGTTANGVPYVHVSSSQTPVASGGSAAFMAEAIDLRGAAKSYSWSADCPLASDPSPPDEWLLLPSNGSWSNQTSQTGTWNAPSNPGNSSPGDRPVNNDCDIAVTVTAAGAQGMGHYQAMVYSAAVNTGTATPSGLQIGYASFPSALAVDIAPGSDPMTGFLSIAGNASSTLVNCRFQLASPFPGDFFFQTFSWWKSLTRVDEPLETLHVPTGSAGGQSWFYLLSPYETFAPTYVTFQAVCDNGSGVVYQDFNTLVLSSVATPGPRVLSGITFSPIPNRAEIDLAGSNVANGFGTLLNLNEGGTVNLVVEHFLLNPRPALPVTVEVCLIPLGSGNCSSFSPSTPNTISVDLTDDPGTAGVREDIRDYRVRLTGQGTPIDFHVLNNRLYTKVKLLDGTIVGSASFAVTAQ